MLVRSGNAVQKDDTIGGFHLNVGIPARRVQDIFDPRGDFIVARHRGDSNGPRCRGHVTGWGGHALSIHRAGRGHKTKRDDSEYRGDGRPARDDHDRLAITQTP